MAKHWVGSYKTIPSEEELIIHFWEKNYKHPLLFPEFDLQTVAKKQATKLWNWLSNRYPCKCKCCGVKVPYREEWPEKAIILCDDCLPCAFCKKLMHMDDGFYVGTIGKWYCYHCYTTKLTECYHCGEELLKKHPLTEHIGGYYLHDTCFYDHYTICVSCGSLVHFDKVYSNDEDGDSFCKHCFEAKFPPSNLPYIGEGSSNPTDRYNLEKSMAMILLRYYATLATELEWGTKEQFRVTEEELKIVSQYFITTAAAELRHAPKCGILVDDHWCLRVLHTYCNSANWRLSSSRNLVMGTTTTLDMDIHNSIKFLQSAYAVFFSDKWSNMEGSFGGKNWANCCLQALNLLSALHSRDGYADRLLWECCLNASHNNSRWLSKVPGDMGTLWVLFVLNLGAKKPPKYILDIYYADDPLRLIPHDSYSDKTRCDFERLPPPETVWTYDEEELEKIPMFTISKMPEPDPPVTKMEKKPITVHFKKKSTGSSGIEELSVICNSTANAFKSGLAEGVPLKEYYPMGAWDFNKEKEVLIELMNDIQHKTLHKKPTKKGESNDKMDDIFNAILQTPPGMASNRGI